MLTEWGRLIATREWAEEEGMDSCQHLLAVWGGKRKFRTYPFALSYGEGAVVYSVRPLGSSLGASLLLERFSSWMKRCCQEKELQKSRDGSSSLPLSVNLEGEKQNSL